MTNQALAFGRRLAELRVNRQLSQESIAEALGVTRMTVVQMEKGLHSPGAEQLAKLAAVFQVQVADLFSTESAKDSGPVLVLQRISELANDEEVSRATERCIALCRTGVSLEGLLERPARVGPPLYNYGIPRQFSEAATHGQRGAEDERRRMQLGDSPAFAVRELIASQWIWAAETELPDSVSGVFLHHSSIGFVVLVNHKHGEMRKRFSLLHEYAHALFDRDLMYTLTSQDNANDLRERRANAFAASFIMPRSGVEAVLCQLRKGGPSRTHYHAYDVANDSGAGTEKRVSAQDQQITGRDIVSVARHFGASFQATCYRLFELDYFDRQQRDAFLARHKESPGMFQIFGLAEDQCSSPALSRSITCASATLAPRELVVQIALLAAEAWQRGAISRGRLFDIAEQLQILPNDLLLATQNTAVPRKEPSDGRRQTAD